MPVFDFVNRYQLLSFGVLSEIVETIERFERLGDVRGSNLPMNQHREPFFEMFHGKLLVNIRGVITETTHPTFDYLGVSYTAADKLLHGFSEMTKRGNFPEEVIIQVSSCGGSPSASQRIAYFFKQLRKKVPIKSIIIEEALSGGFLIAASAGKGNVFASVPLSRCGSIGVISLYRRRLESGDKGVTFVEEKIGDFKAAEASQNTTDEAEKSVNDRMVQIYNQFLRDVSVFRELPLEAVKEIADGRFFYAKEAIELKLIDGLLDLPHFYSNHQVRGLFYEVSN